MQSRQSTIDFVGIGMPVVLANACLFKHGGFHVSTGVFRYISASAIRTMAIVVCVGFSPIVCDAEQADGLFLEPTSVDLTSYCDDACAVDCGDGCNCGSACSGKLFGFLKPSDHCFDSFISPITNPVFFEDPRTLTEARAIYLNHNVPAATAGGDVQLIAVQLRAALTERLSLIATKDGYVISSNPLIEDGWADVAAGLKYNLFADPVAQRLLSTGATYEMPVGTPGTRQGNGDGEFHVFLTGGTEILTRGHWISASGFRLPVDNNAESTMWYWSNHWDYEFAPRWYALTEVNWYNWTRSGDNTALAGVEGGDLFNFGSVGVAGNNIVTQALGVKFKRNRHHELGAAFEVPLTERRDILESRFTLDWILRY